MSRPLLISQCFMCEHFTGGVYHQDGRSRCGAYPDGIPERVRHGLLTHEYPFGDEQTDGVLFEPKAGLDSSDLQAWLNDRIRVLYVISRGLQAAGVSDSPLDCGNWMSMSPTHEPVDQPADSPEATLVWGWYEDGGDGTWVFLTDHQAILLAATAQAITESSTIRDLQQRLPEETRDWVLSHYQQWYDDEGLYSDDELPAFDDWEISSTTDNWYGDGDFLPAWPQLNHERVQDQVMSLLSAEAYEYLDDQGWIADTGEGYYYRIEDPDDLIDMLTPTGIRYVRDDDLITRAAGP